MKFIFAFINIIILMSFINTSFSQSDIDILTDNTKKKTKNQNKDKSKSDVEQLLDNQEPEQDHNSSAVPSSNTESSSTEKKGLGDQEKKLIIGGEISVDYAYNFLYKNGAVYDLYNRDNYQEYHLYYNVYLDIRYNNNVRGYFDIEHKFTPTENAIKDEQPVDLREAFIEFEVLDYVSFRLGKQVVKWGKGLVWNPTDKLNFSKNPFDPDEKRSGITSILSRFSIGTVNLYLIKAFDQKRKIDEVPIAFKFEFLIDMFEFGFSTIIEKGKKPLFGFDFSGSISSLILYGELAYTHSSNKDLIAADGSYFKYAKKNIFQIVMGLELPIESIEQLKLQFNLEYFYNGLGYNSNDIAGVMNNIKDNSANLALRQDLYTYTSSQVGKELQQHYLYFGFKAYDVLNTQVSYELKTIISLSDGSLYLAPSIEISEIENITFEIFAHFYFGKNLTEFRLPGIFSTVGAKATVYF